MKGLLKFIRNVILIILLIGIIIAGYVIYDGYKLYKDVISKESIEDAVNKIESKEDFLSYDEIPKDYINATVAVEDHRFYEHPGFDVISIGRALVTNIKNLEIVEGGSTITQQLAKNMYFSFEKKFSRKVAEVFVAIDLEKKYDKDEILALYINVIYFGDGYYGLNAASHGYFDKEPSELTFDEITLLAGLPNAPSAYAPTTNSSLARKRQELVIEQMKKYGYKVE